MAKKPPRISRDHRPRGCRACGGTGQVQNMRVSGVYTDPKTGKTYEVRKPVWEACKCQS